MKLDCNCCDGIYNSLDVHFTSACDNKCAHCVDMRFSGMGVTKPDVAAIVNTIIKNQKGLDDVLFLGGEPCLYLNELLECVRLLRKHTWLKLYVTTAVPKICHDQRDTFVELLSLLDGMNLSVQHHREDVADQIRRTTSEYDRQAFYENIHMTESVLVEVPKTLRERWIDPLKDWITTPFEPWVKTKMVFQQVPSRVIYQTAQGLVMHPETAAEFRRQLAAGKAGRVGTC